MFRFKKAGTNCVGDGPRQLDELLLLNSRLEMRNQRPCCFELSRSVLDDHFPGRRRRNQRRHFGVAQQTLRPGAELGPSFKPPKNDVRVQEDSIHSMPQLANSSALMGANNLG
jgi:hypothetical protein